MKRFCWIKKIFVSLLTIIIVVFIFHFFLNQAQAGDIYKAKKSISKATNQIKETKKQVVVNQNQYNINQSQIVSTQSVITKTQKEIERKEKVIQNLNKRIKLNKQILKSYIQEMSFDNSNNPVINFVLSRGFLNDLSGNFDQIINVKEKILSVIGDISQNKKELALAKEALAKKKIEKQKILVVKQNEQVRVISNIRRAKATLAQLTAKINALRNRLSSLLGGSVSMHDIKNAAKIASKATGVRKDFIMGMLVVESDLGRYTGGCNYKESRMSSYRKTIFKSICKSLGYNYKKKKVSCPPRGYLGTGGAMGVAQFMSDTWKGYEAIIASRIGHNPPDPWNVYDGIMAMASKLAKDGATRRSGECTAAKRYLGGNHQWYCDRVLYWAKNYGEKIN